MNHPFGNGLCHGQKSSTGHVQAFTNSPSGWIHGNWAGTHQLVHIDTRLALLLPKNGWKWEDWKRNLREKKRTILGFLGPNKRISKLMCKHCLLLLLLFNSHIILLQLDAYWAYKIHFYSPSYWAVCSWSWSHQWVAEHLDPMKCVAQHMGMRKHQLHLQMDSSAATKQRNQRGTTNITMDITWCKLIWKRVKTMVCTLVNTKIDGNGCSSCSSHTMW